MLISRKSVPFSGLAPSPPLSGCGHHTPGAQGQTKGTFLWDQRKDGGAGAAGSPLQRSWAGGQPGTPAAEACFPETSGRRPQEPRLASNPAAQQRMGCSILRQGRWGGVLFASGQPHALPWRGAPTARSSLQGRASYDSLPQAAAPSSFPKDRCWMDLP